MPAAAAELVRLKPDVIVALTNVAAFPAKQATSTIPIVVWGAHGALETGLVPSLSHPGINVTGVESLAPEVDAKRLELLNEIVPRLATVAVLYNADDRGSPVHLKCTLAAARALGISISTLEVRRAADFDGVQQAVARQLPDALLTFSDVLTYSYAKRVADFALTHRLPTICEFKEMAEAGCLISYEPSFAEFAQINAGQVDRILRGAKAGDLPVEQATPYEMIVNLKTARALGITIPQSVRARANELID
jgi:putative tryptophan/tyrosine transport system substrate-binding protein